MAYRIVGLNPDDFTPLFALSDEQLAARNIVRVVADSFPGYPCRVSLCDAQPGESLLLLNYEHLPLATPYRSSHAIYVRESARERYDRVGCIPESLRVRILSVRAFDDSGMMIDADVVSGTEVEHAIERLLRDPRAAYLHLHNAKPGCYAARVERAPDHPSG
jgi:hypothetical protein